MRRRGEVGQPFEISWGVEECSGSSEAGGLCWTILDPRGHYALLFVVKVQLLNSASSFLHFVALIIIKSPDFSSYLRVWLLLLFSVLQLFLNNLKDIKVSGHKNICLVSVEESR